MRREALQGALVIATEDGDGVLHRCPGERGVVPVALVLTLVEEYMNQVAKVIQENDRQVVDASRVDGRPSLLGHVITSRESRDGGG